MILVIYLHIGVGLLICAERDDKFISIKPSTLGRSNFYFCFSSEGG